LSTKNQALQLLFDKEIPISNLSRSLMDLITMVDSSGIIQYVSPQNKAGTGRYLENEVGTSVFEYIHPDDQERVRQIFFVSLQNHASGRVQYRYQHYDGYYMHFETIGNPLCRGRKVVGAVLSSRDISDQMIKEKSVNLPLDMYIKAFRCNPDPITISTLDEGRYVDVNDAFRRYMGYTREEVVGETADNLRIWAVQGDRNRVIANILQNGSLRDMEMEFISKSGDIMTGLLSVDIIAVNNKPHLLSIIRDITERKNLEQALRSLEERFFKAFNVSPITMSISTVEDGICIDVNRAFRRATGYTRSEVLGRSFLELGIWDDPSQRQLVKESLLNGKQVSEMEARFVTKSGELRCGLYSAEMIEVGGQACILSLMVDMTERREIERELARLDRMNLVGQIAVSIGHEIRNPMTTIRGYLQLLRLQKKYFDEYETMDLMIEEIDRSNAIISEFISLAHDKYVHLEPHDLNRVLINMLPALKSAAALQDKYIEIDVDNLPYILMDENEILQLIRNLAQNGLEAMPPGGTLRIATMIQGTDVVLAVQDEGSGMSDEVRDKLGTPFFTTKDDRTGLGMAVCYGIARRHNALIDCKSDMAGTTVQVVFPAND